MEGGDIVNLKLHLVLLDYVFMESIYRCYNQRIMYRNPCFTG